MTQQARLVTFPEELLLSIFELVEEDRPTGDGFATWDRNPESVRTLQNLRLTCRRFHEIASTLLIPTTRVGFTRSSMERFEKICSHRLISQGVRVVQVVLDMFDERKVADFKTFEDHMREDITSFLNRKWGRQELATQSTWEETLRCKPKLRRARILLVTLRYREVLGAAVLRPPEDDLEQTEKDMNKAWEIYRSFVQFQTRLCEPALVAGKNGITVFAKRLALAMAKMSGARARTIEFRNTPRRILRGESFESMFSPKRPDPPRSNFEIFYEPFLLTGIDCLISGTRHYTAIFSKSPGLYKQQTFRLSTASRNITPEWYPHDQKYLTTCLAVPTLERISLEGPRYQIRYGRSDWAREDFNFSGRESLSRYMPALARRVTAAAAIGVTTSGITDDGRDWRDDEVEDPNIRINRNLRRVYIHGGVFQLKDLRKLLQSFPRSGLDELSIRHVRLLRDDDEIPGHPKEREPNVVGTRSWEKVLDLLREGLAIRRPRGVRLRKVCTDVYSDEGEGIWGKSPYLDLDFDEWMYTGELVEMGLGSEPLSPAEEYVTRLSDVNPIRVRREREEERMRAAEEDRKEWLSGAPFFGVSSLDHV